MRAVVLGAVLLAGVGLVGCSSSSPAADAPQPSGSSGGIAGVKTYTDLTRNHTTADVTYPQTPPVGGDHDPDWIDCTGQVYTQPLRNENAVHSLEHGAVWLTYNSDVSSKDVATLAKQVDGRQYSFMSPYPDQPAPIMLTAWGLQLSVDSATDPRIDEFLSTYAQGPQTPEPNAPCAGGIMP